MNGEVPRQIILTGGCEADHVLSWIDYASIFSMRQQNPDFRIRYMYLYKPKGKWFERACEFVELEKVDFDFSQISRPLFFASKSDLLRMHWLSTEGGVYSDTDVLHLRPMTDLIDDPERRGRAVLGKESFFGFSNCLIVTPPGNPFIARWEVLQKAELNDARLAPVSMYLPTHSIYLPYQKYIKDLTGLSFPFRSRNQRLFSFLILKSISWAIGRHPDLQVLSHDVLNWPRYRNHVNNRCLLDSGPLSLPPEVFSVHLAGMPKRLRDKQGKIPRDSRLFGLLRDLGLPSAILQEIVH